MARSPVSWNSVRSSLVNNIHLVDSAWKRDNLDIVILPLTQSEYRKPFKNMGY